MPTNKLWIEHTERAAWDSVEALRERLAKAEERLQALLPNVERVPRLLELLERAKREYAATAQGFDEVVEELLRRLEATQAELALARAPEPLVASFQAAPPRARFDSEDLDLRASPRASDDTDLSEFTRAMCRRQQRADGELPRDVNRLLALAETKLDDLTELEGTELRGAALELAIFGFSHLRSFRGAAQRPPWRLLDSIGFGMSLRALRQALLAAAAGALACQPAEPSRSVPSPSPSVSAATAAVAHSAEPAAGAAASPPTRTMHTFAEDLEFLSQHGPIKVLESPAGGRIAISGKYQARVMTSAVGAQSASLGFVNRSFIEAGKTGTAFDNYGGEDRFWLGPEGGQFALYFPAGKPFDFGNWQTPEAFQEGEWLTTDASTASSVTFTRSLTFTNYRKTPFTLQVERKLALISAEQAKASLGIDIPAGLAWVGFASDNKLTNLGKHALVEPSGLPSIWILGMFMPAPGTRVIMPFEKGTSEPVSDRYFGKVSADRLRVYEDKGFLLFECDGKQRGKIGLGAARAKNVLGSFSAEGKILTIVRFTRPPGAKRYVNNLWEISKKPFSGDVSNAYNDGPVEPGKPSLGGFYELESSSPAAALAPGGSLSHVHETYHFTGSREELETIAQKVLGVSLKDVESVPP